MPPATAISESPSSDGLGCEADGFETGAADHVDGESGDGVGETAAECGLARGILAEAGGEDAAHDALGDVCRIDGRAFDGGADGDGAELDGGEMRECAEEFADGGSGCTDDDDFAHEGSCDCGDDENQQRAKGCCGNNEVYDAPSNDEYARVKSRGQ